MSGTSWNLENLVVEGKYLGDIPVRGKVMLSRVQYGGQISHHILLDKPIEVYGAVRETVIVEHKWIEYVSE